jgi:putative toxin-antitoxin system antitoxin component (TIGR02293 family)
MAKNQKLVEVPNAKSGQYVTRTVASRALSPKNTMVIIDVAIPDHGSYHSRTAIIVEKTDRPEWQMTAVEKMDMVREGVSKKKLESLKSKTNLDYDKLSTILSTTRATLINKKGTEHFSTALSERIVSIADLYSYGFEVFEDESKFNEWIFRPNQALGGKQPFELLDNHFGREEVKNVIGRINYGVYS